uniref:C2H2-type domain-containing protein n=1 Tax=Esox lucius TaxID=8010 RepID=A0AAY5KKB7_ESOLU
MQTLREKQGPPLPLSSLRLFVPPLRLVCAAMWQIVERRDIMDYGLLEEFATTVLDIVPELMTYRERVQLLMGLRARLILELCRCDDELCRPDTVQPHLNRIRSCISSQGVSDPKVEASEASFSKLIETLLEEPDERELFFQNVFPEEFGSKYDSTLQMLVQEFLSRLEKLLPPPNLQQTASWLSIAPALIEECVQSVAHPEPLQTLLRHQKNGQQLDTNALRSVGGDYILSSLSSRCSGKEGSASSEVGTERQSYPTMQGYQSPLPCDEPGMRWDCRLADYRVWTVKPPAGSACVEVEVDTIEVATEKSGKRKTIGKDTIKGTRRDKAVLCPQTRSGLKTSRLTASCLCRKPVLRLNRLDISNMPLPKSLLTLILRRGRLQGEATRRPGPKRRGRKKKRKKGHGVTNQKIETHALDVSDTPPPKSSLKLTLKRGIVQAEATSSQVPKKRGRKKGQKIGPGITKLKIEKIGAQTLDISDMPLPKPSLKLIIRRGKLQAEATDSQEQKRRGRKRKQKRGRGVKNEKTEAKGVNRERANETEEDAEPSKNELRTTVTKAATVNDSGGVHVRLHSPSSHKKKKLQQHNFQSEHCGQMAKWQRRELLEGVPQDSLTPEPSNTCHKRSQRVKACSFCGKTFTDTLDLTRHMRSHIEQKSHQCIQCGQDFEFGEDLEEHQNNVCKVNKNNNDEDNNKDSCKETNERNTNLVKKHLKRDKNTKRKRDNKTDLKVDFQVDEKPVLKEEGKTDLKEYEKPDLNEDEKPDLKGDTQHCSIKCHVCGKITTRMLGLRRHLLVHFNNGAYKCPVCPKTFTTNADLRSHLRLKRSCREKCSEEFIMTKVHLQPVPCQNICPYCGDTFQLPHDLKGHTKECSRKCHVCGKTTLKACNMRRHILKHYNNGPIKCPVCPKTFISHPDFKMHLKTKKCCREKCSDVMMKELLSSVEGKCKENINETEVMTRSQQPSSSNTGGPGKSMEEFFEQLAHDQPDNSVNCDSLHVDFNDEICQNQPIENIDQSKPCEYKCPYCRATFQLPHDLKGHTKECSRKCHVCGKTTSKACDMRRHMLKHYNNGPIKCPVCPKTFIFHTDLKIHLKTKKICRENCSDVMMKELLSSVDGRRIKKVNKTGVKKCQQPSSSNTNGPVLGLKSFEKLFEELHDDSQPANNNISSDVNINSFHENYSDKINHYEPMNDVDLKSLDDHKDRISHKLTMRDIDKSNPTKFNCPYCGDTFQLPHDLKGHTKNCSRKCHVCGKTSSKTCDMRRHMLKHDNNGPIKCPVCPKTFIFHTDLKTHLKTKKFCREKCSDVMAKELLSSVDSKHRKKLNKTKVMTKCQPPSSSSTSVPVLGLKSFEEFFEELSHDSDISMSSDVNLISLHEETSSRSSHNQPSDVNLISLHEETSSRSSHNEPIKDTGQSNPGEYKCPYCGDTFQLPHDLKGHTKECSRKCNVCGKTTSTTCGMRRHMLKHYNNGSHKCPVCPKTFIFYTDMKKHLKTKKLCRENFSNLTAEESLSSADGQYKEHVNETGIMTRCQQPSSSNTDRPVLGLKTFEEFFEELSQDQPDEGMSNDCHHVDFNEEISQYQPMKDVDLNNLQEDYSDEINQYQPMNDVDLNSLHGHYSNDISQY